MKLDKGAEVTAVGLRFEWLKVVPPEGSFCYAAKAYIDRHGDGRQGRVTSTLNVRVGSQLNELKAKIATKLEPGASVEIIGEEQEYFKIKPPTGVFFYVNKQFVDPVRAVNLAQADPQKQAGPQVPLPQPEQPSESQSQPPAPAPSDTGATAQDTTTTPTDTSNSGIASNDPLDTTVTPTAPTPTPSPSPSPSYTSPSAAVAQQRERTTPATQPVAAANEEAEFDRLEKEYADATLRPINDQPVAQLLEGYQKLSNSNTLPESLRRIAEFKVEVLKSRLEVQNQFAETQRVIDDMKTKQMALGAEQQELEQRIKDNDIQFYTAVGTLRPSSLQQGNETLYRLTDPSNGRTIVYLRSSDNKLAAMIGQFIGVKGEVQTEAQLNLRVVSPSEVEPVNPAKVGQSIAAQIVPPSLLPGGATAQTE
jgi:hypothetical protein